MAAGFKDLVVWQKGIDLVEAVYESVAQLPDSESYGLASQMTRAATSIPSNIAEGYRRNNRAEYRHFCAIAVGSAAELETQLIITRRVYSQIDIEPAMMLDIEVQKMLTTLISKLS